MVGSSEAPAMMDFPITDLMDEHACYQWLLGLLHPKGLACPRCGGTAAYVHRFYREEADEAYQNAGEKGVPHTDPADPPRRRANKAVGHGTWENDRVPIAGVVGRDGRLDLKVARRPSRAELVDGFVVPSTHEGTVVDTDDWCVYAALPGLGRRHASVNHAHSEWARDGDGDGEREVHDNTLEGIWTGLREYLRPFRGVNKVYLAPYVAMFRWAYNLKAITPRFLRTLLGVSILTYSGP